MQLPICQPFLARLGHFSRAIRAIPYQQSPLTFACLGIQRLDDDVACAGGQDTNDERLDRPPQTGAVISNGHKVLDVAKDEEDDGRDGNGDHKGLPDVGHDKVRNHGDQAADEVAEAHGDARDPRAVNVGPLEAQRKVDHEARPVGAVAAELVDERLGGGAGDGVALQDGVDLGALGVGHGVDVAALARLLRGVVVALRDGGQVRAEAHGDHAREELGQAAHDDNLAAAEARQAGRQGKGHRQPVGEANDDVAQDVGRVEEGALLLGHRLDLLVDGRVPLNGRLAGKQRGRLAGRCHF